VKLDALVRAHGYMRTERPPGIWEADTEDVRFIPLLGEMISAGLVGGAQLEELVLNVSNVVVSAEEAGGDWEGPGIPVGEFVAVTVRGRTDLGPDHSWWPRHPARPGLLLGRIEARLVDAGALYAYVRRMPPEGSVTVFLRRMRRL
jgi:hypothetical protein